MCRVFSSIKMFYNILLLSLITNVSAVVANALPDPFGDDEESASINFCKNREGLPGPWKLDVPNGYVNKTTGRCMYFVGEFCGGAASSCPSDTECAPSKFNDYHVCTCKIPFSFPTPDRTGCRRGLSIGKKCDAPEGVRVGATTVCMDHNGICSKGVCICNPVTSLHLYRWGRDSLLPPECRLKVGQSCWSNECSGICVRNSTSDSDSPGICGCKAGFNPSRTGHCNRSFYS